MDVVGHFTGVFLHEYGHFAQMEKKEAEAGMDARTAIEDNFQPPGVGAEDKLWMETDDEIKPIRQDLRDAADPEPTGNWTGKVWVYDDVFEEWIEVPRNP